LPELPEVEVTRRAVAPHLVGRRIARVRTTAPSYFFLTPPARLKRALTGRKVVRLDRHGKYLLALLDDDSRLLLHLGMTGQLFAAGARSVRLLSAERRSTLAPGVPPAFRPDAHTHLELEFADGPSVIAGIGNIYADEALFLA
jgi:formamidopyrimidine-DNA glycosylase